MITMIKKMIFIALLLAVSLAGAAVAGPFEDRVAAEGDAYTQFMLGLVYDQGQGGPQDYVQAVAWYRKAADQGNAAAQVNLGVKYERGQGVPQDYVQAVAWYRKAADQGNASARTNLGVMYANGQGVPQDYIQAHMWWNLAASRYTDPTDRADAVKRRDLVAAKMTPTQIAEAQRLASAWKPK